MSRNIDRYAFIIYDTVYERVVNLETPFIISILVNFTLANVQQPIFKKDSKTLPRKMPLIEMFQRQHIFSF